MELGVCYYPEHWPQEVWADDAMRMKALGLSSVRIGEFAWSKIEPQEGEFHWDWLDCAFETLSKAGLSIILGTPTATPPIWVVEKYPDMLALDKEGRPRIFGSRRHYCFSHLGYRKEAARIARALSKRYGTHEALKAWQTDNEYGCHDTSLSFSNAAQRGFQEWLSQKYQSIDALNRRWGTMFWSMEYRDFNDINLPNLTVTEAAPAHLMDFRRYTSEQIVAFNRAQVDAMRPYSNRDICHNYMGRITDFDHFDVAESLDVAAWDSYPLGFLEDRITASEAHKARFSRTGDPDFQSFHHDLYRAVGKGRWWVMEQQPGPVNWAPYNPAPLKGMVKLWSLEAAAHGAELVSYFRWRQAPFAQEQMHSGLNRVNNSPAEAFFEVEELTEILKEHGQFEALKADVALIFDYPSQWAWEIERQGVDFDYFDVVFDYYRALRRLGLNIDILPSNLKHYSDYKLIIAPAVFTLSDDFEHALKASGATLVIGPRAGLKTEDFEIQKTLKPLSGVDVTIERVESLRPSDKRPLEEGGAVIKWCEHIASPHAPFLSLKSGEAIAVSYEPFIYVGAWLDGEGLRVFFKKICENNKITTLDLPDALRKRETRHHDFYFNHDAQDIIFNERIFPAASVTILSKEPSS